MKTAVIGLQYGDEGKGRVVGYFSKDYDWSIRFNGGGNAGHTVYGDDGRKFKLHQIPSGSVYGKKLALDTGMVLNLDTLSEEIEMLEEAGLKPDIYVSENVHLITQDHLNDDASGSGIGSTKRGIAYVYADRAKRKGVRVSRSLMSLSNCSKDMKCHDKIFFGRHNHKLKRYRGLPPIAKHESAIFEGAQGIMLDVDYGDYPYVTSSSVIPSMAHKIDKTIGVMKAYTTRVGDGPPWNEDIEELRIRGNEFGTTTGRPRRCHWNDIDQLAYAFSIVQPDEVVVTKLDILDGMDDIGVYKNNEFIKIGCLDSYKYFLLNTFPQIKWFSESPSGDLIKVR